MKRRKFTSEFILFPFPTYPEEKFNLQVEDLLSEFLWDLVVLELWISSDYRYQSF